MLRCVIIISIRHAADFFYHYLQQCGSLIKLLDENVTKLCEKLMWNQCQELQRLPEEAVKPVAGFLVVQLTIVAWCGFKI